MPNVEMVEMVSSASPPRVSATIGIKSTPADLHDGRFAATFLLTPTSNACPGV